MITILLVFFSFIIWNIFNETLFLKYNGIKSKLFQYDWHTYDALFRIFLFAVVIIDEYKLSLFSLKLYIALLLFYHILFDIGFNYKRSKDQNLLINIHSLFHLGTNFLDEEIRKIGVGVNKLLIKLKLEKFATPLTVPIVNIIIKFVELILGLYLCFG